MVSGFAAEALPAQTGRLAEELRLDANAEDFPPLIRVQVGPQRQIVVAMFHDNRFRIYDSTGNRLGDVGRTGSGPGEFRQPGPAAWIADTMWAYDVTLTRTSFFGPDLKLIRTVVAPTATMPGAPSWEYGMTFWPMMHFADGSTFGSSQSPTRVGASTWESFVAMQSPTGRVTRVAASPKFEDPRWFMFSGPFGNPVPFATTPQIGFALDGSRYGFLVVEHTTNDEGVYTVSNYRRNGAVIFVEKFPFHGVPIPTRVRDSALAKLLAPSGEVSARQREEFKARAEERMPRVYPPVDQLLFGLDGTTWLIGRLTDTSRVATVLNGAGKVIGTVAVPKHSTVRQATATQLWVTERDDDGLASVVRYRVSGLESGRR